MVFRNRDIKEILDVKLSTEIDWNGATEEKYWLLYADIETINQYKRP